jgi:filamentous hemagglutinin family protein
MKFSYFKMMCFNKQPNDNIAEGWGNSLQSLRTCGTAIATVTIAIFTVGKGNLNAQIVPDNSLVNPSTVTPEGDRLILEGGTRSGDNLFHSFSEFSVPRDTGAWFNNGLDIQNIFTRVTGNSISTIDGLISANGSANLFLLNPNGIVFGANARLDLGGSFVATTASEIQFADRLTYSASNPQNGAILSNRVPIGLGFGSDPGAIVNRSVAADAEGNPVGLQVRPGRELRAIGGEIRLDGGRLSAPGGAIELTAIAAGSWPLGGEVPEPESLEYRDIRAIDRARIDATGDGGGAIAVRGRNVEIRDGSQVVSFTRGGTAGQPVNLYAREGLSLVGRSPSDGEPSRISSQTVGSGDAGHLTVDAQTVLVDDGVISATTSSTGRGGDLTVRATESVELVGGNFNAQLLGLVNATLGRGDAGDLTVETGRLQVREGAVVVSGTRSAGNAGNLTVRAREEIEAIGTSPDGTLASSLQTAATDGPDALRERFGTSEVTGNAGNLTLETGRLLVRDGAVISTSTEGSGAGGTLNVSASEAIAVEGVSGDRRFASGLLSDTTGAGDGGDATLRTGRLTLGEGALISVRTFATGNGGDLNIEATESITLRGSGFETFQREFIGAALSRQLSLAQLRNGIFTGAAGSGNSGNIRIQTGDLSLLDGAAISTSTFGEGSGGNLTIAASGTVEAVGSGLFGATLANGRAGNLELDARRLVIRDGASVSTVTFGPSPGGQVKIRTTDSVDVRSTPPGSLTPTGIFTNTIGSTGAAGDIAIATARVRLEDGGQMLTNSGANTRDGVIPFGGSGGNLTVTASESVELSGIAPDGRVSSALGTSTFSAADAGSLTISTGRLILRDGAGAFASAEGSGNGGTLSVNASESIAISGSASQGRFRPSGLFATSGSDLLPQEATGRGGDLQVNTRDLIVRDGGQISVNSVEAGDAGTLFVDAEMIRLENGGQINGATAAGSGGNLTLEARQIQLRDRSQITTDAGSSNGGNIAIAADTLIALENSDITANAREGRGGRVTIAASGIFGTAFREVQTPESDITASSELGPEFGGTVEINAPEVNLLDALTQLSTEFVNAEQLVAESCLARRNRDSGSFTVTGTGGLPEDPYGATSDRYDLSPIRGIGDNASNSRQRPPLSSGSARETTWKIGQPIREARGIATTADGRTVLGTSPGAIAPELLDPDVCDRVGESGL